MLKRERKSTVLCRGVGLIYSLDLNVLYRIAVLPTFVQMYKNVMSIDLYFNLISHLQRNMHAEISYCIFMCGTVTDL